MKRSLIIVGILAQFVVTQAALATTLSFTDNTKIWSGWTNNVGTQNTTDSIGSPQIVTTKVDLDKGLMSSITFTGLYPLPTNVYAGDLFINLLNSKNDTTWDYVVRSLNGTDGAYDIFKVNVDALKNPASNPYEMSYYQYPGNNNTNFRSLHPIGVKDDQLLGNSVGTATLSGLYSNTIKYDFGKGLDTLGLSFIIGWTPTCANDVIYQEVPVPEPGTMALLGFGLLGLVVYSKRRMGKQV